MQSFMKYQHDADQEEYKKYEEECWQKDKELEKWRHEDWEHAWHKDDAHVMHYVQRWQL